MSFGRNVKSVMNREVEQKKKRMGQTFKQKERPHYANRCHSVRSDVKKVVNREVKQKKRMSMGKTFKQKVRQFCFPYYAAG